VAGDVADHEPHRAVRQANAVEEVAAQEQAFIAWPVRRDDRQTGLDAGQEHPLKLIEHGARQTV
jgi:hypothetical protein